MGWIRLGGIIFKLMISRGIATFTLDYGKCPRWLWERMLKLGREMVYIIVDEYGPEELVRRVADPVWFQSLGTVLAFDWNASGLTTILTAVLKESIRGREEDLGLYIAGGKGKTSRRTPDEIIDLSERANISDISAKSLVYNSKMAAKVDSSLVQDGYQLYHHTMFFAYDRSMPHFARTSPLGRTQVTSQNGHLRSTQEKSVVWSVVQQGMNTENTTARRYHWYSDNIENLVIEPHSGIASQAQSSTLNLTNKKSKRVQDNSIGFIKEGYNSVMKDINILRRHSSTLSKMISARKGETQLTLLDLYDQDFNTHPVVNEDFGKSKYLEKVLYQVCEQKPKNYESLLSQKGIGPKTMRALSLVSEVIYGAAPSYEDPARYSFAHGGKDAIPYPVDRKTYDQTIEFFKKVINKTRLGFNEKQKLVSKLEAK